MDAPFRLVAAAGPGPAGGREGRPASALCPPRARAGAESRAWQFTVQAERGRGLFARSLVGLPSFLPPLTCFHFRFRTAR